MLLLYIEWIQDVRDKQSLSRTVLKAEADNYIFEYEQMETERKKEEKDRVTAAAADGWTLVTHKGKRDKV